MALHVVVVLSCLLVVVSTAPQSDLITNLPGLEETVAFKQYSGYLKAQGGRMLHYWFIESASSPSQDPVVLWMNGGPGCSSMDGLLSEHGPFKPTLDGQKLIMNPYSWNKVANMLYLEAPAGVGYSYTPDGNVTTSDDQVSLDNYVALKFFFSNFPEFSKNDFYITGESYGGIYVPTLASRVVDDQSFNFKGFAVGNGLSSNVMNGNSMMFYAYYHGLIGTDMWTSMVSACCKGGKSDDCDFVENDNPSCQNEVNQVTQLMWGLNVYNLYANCFSDPGTSLHASSQNNTRKTHRDILYWIFKKNKKFMMSYQLDANPPVDATSIPPCIDARNATNYLNLPEVRKALHIPDNLPTWGICNDAVGALYHRQYSDMEAQYKKVLATGKQRIMIYNGDADMACNFLGDEWFVDSLKLKVEKKWGSWTYTAHDGSEQVAGFTVHYQNLAFVTVKGAGHMVPQDKPIPALLMLSHFLKGSTF